METFFSAEIIVALIAIFGSFVGLVITKEQKTSEFRQAWINTLRDDISKFVGEIDRVTKLVRLNKSASEEEKKETARNVILNSVEMRTLQLKISLLINSKEEKHNRLTELINEIILNIKNLRDNVQNIEKLTKISQQILKEEWNRVKKGEPIFNGLKWILGIFIGAILLFILFKALCG